MNKKCIYTYIIGGYDSVKEPKIVTPGWDYICVTDNPNLKSEVWNIVNINSEDKKIEPGKRRAMSCKIGFNNYLTKKYDCVITIDGDIVVNINLDDCLKKYNYSNENDAVFMIHPNRDCVYDEGYFLPKVGRETTNNIYNTLQKYTLEKYPKNNGLYASGLMIINNSKKNIRDFFNVWLNEYKTSPSMRDQMTFNYSIWKYENKTKNKLNINKIKFRDILTTDFYTTGHIKTHEEAMKSNIVDLEEKVNEIFATPSDINEHIPTIIKYGQECDHITEMGVRGVISTWGWLGAAPKNGLVSYDIHHPSKFGGSLESVEATAKAYDIKFKFIQANVLDIDIDETDLLFIDTWHHYNQLKSELEKHADKAKKYICFHDTTSYEHRSEPTTSEHAYNGDLDWSKGIWDAVEEFLDDNKDTWKLKERFKNNNGFTVIERI